MWTSRKRPTDLPEGCVDLWRLSLEGDDDVVARASRALDDPERARAERFRFQPDRRCYVLTRSSLRQLLSGYLDILGSPASPAQIAFVEGAHGKPALSPEQQPDDARLKFNVSHSGAWALIAVTRHGPVGVDIEEMRPRKSLKLVAEHHFTPSEFEAVIGGPDERRLERFYRCWTRKEAYLKATGEGLARGLGSFAVSVDGKPGVRWTEQKDAEKWHLVDVASAEGYLGAACVRAEEAPQKWRQFDVVLVGSK